MKHITIAAHNKSPRYKLFAIIQPHPKRMVSKTTNITWFNGSFVLIYVKIWGTINRVWNFQANDLRESSKKLILQTYNRFVGGVVVQFVFNIEGLITNRFIIEIRILRQEWMLKTIWSWYPVLWIESQQEGYQVRSCKRNIVSERSEI